MSIREAYINVSRDRVFHYAILTLVIVAAAFSYSILNDRASAQEEVQTLHVFPGAVESDAWVNTNTLFIQDVFEDATFGEFSPANSAFVQETSEQVLLDEESATTTEEVVEEESATTTVDTLPEETSTTTEEVVDDVATTTATTTEEIILTPATTTDEEESESFGETIIDAIIDLFDGPDEDQGTTTENQEAAVIEVLPEEEETPEVPQSIPDNPVFEPQNTSTTTEELETEAATGTVGSLWGVLKNIFTNIVVAQVGTTTEEVPEEPLEEIVEEPTVSEESATTTEEVVEEESATTTVDTLPEETSTTTEEVVDDVATTTATTTEEVLEEPVVETPQSETPTETPEDTEPPVIVIQGNNPARINVGDSYNDLGALIPEVRDSNLGITTKVNGVEMRQVQLDTSSSTVYIIEYSATDVSGNTGYAERIVYVGDAELPEEEVSTDDIDFNFITSFCDEGNDTCFSEPIEFSGFGISETLGEQGIRNAQLRFSLAAQPHALSESSDEGIVIEYFYRGDWRQSGTLSFDDEVSNAVNGGYFLYALPIFNDWSELEDLRVRVTYQNAHGNVGQVFLESLWLEIETGIPGEGESFDLMKLLGLDEDDGFVEENLEGDVLVLPDGTELEFTNTDENEDETLIIKTDEALYQGLTRTTTYFSVTNTAFSSDTFTIQTYFPKGVGEVISIEEWNQNRPKTTVVPQYQSIVYQCEGGWKSIDDLETRDTELPEGASPILLKEEALLEITEEKLREVISEEEIGLPMYVCAETQTVRECNAFSDGNRGCEATNVKVNSYNTTRFEGGWEKSRIVNEVIPEETGFFARVQDFFGLNGPDRKEVPDSFEPKERTTDSYTIEPGETKFFRMEISFPPHTTGEYWIEAIGEDKLYGLLDPFWSSSWQYKIPVTLDNATSTDTLTEHQVLLTLDSSLTDFWTNVNDDGSDIRFLRENNGTDQSTWYDTSWQYRLAIEIPDSVTGSDLTDFPVYVNLADLGTTFFSNVQSDGDDIRITEGDGFTELAREIVSINTGAETGQMFFNASTISSSATTTFYVYYGNTGAIGYSDTDTYGAENTWNSNYLGVYHLEEDASGTGNTNVYIDSTSNGDDADDEVASTGKTGKLGQGQQIEGRDTADDDYILVPNGVLDSETNVTNSFWFNTGSGGSQAIVSAGGGNNYLIFLTGSTLQFFSGTDISFTTDVTVNNNEWHHMTIVRDDTSNQTRLYINGVEDNTSPTAQTHSTLSIPTDCTVIGQEQDGCLGNLNAGQGYDGFVDEMTFMSGVQSADWIAATYNNQATSTDFYATTSQETFVPTTFTELDFWTKHFSTTTDDADIWVQVDTIPAQGSTTIYMYYGNSSATDASDEWAPFTYSTTTDTYYVVQNDQVDGTIDVFSLIDNNVIQLDGGTEISLNRGESTFLSGFASTSVVSTLGPISVTINDNNVDTLAPISFATSTFVAPTQRNTNFHYFYSPFGSSTVSIYDGNAPTPAEVISVATNTAGVSTVDPTGNGVVVESTEPILYYHVEATRDSVVNYPPTTEDLYGIHTGGTLSGALVANPDPTVYCSDGGTDTASNIDRGDAQALGNSACTELGQGAGPSVRFTGAADPIAVFQQADNDGSETTAYWPDLEFNTLYYLPGDTAYVAIACAPRFGTSTIEIRDNTGLTVLDSGTCTPSGTTDPGKVYLDNGQGGSALAFAQGSYVVSTNGVPFYAMYEDDEEDNDETNMLGAAQGRKWTEYEIGVSFGAQEAGVDAEYEQTSYRWFENVNSLEPTVAWTLDSETNETADERDPITSAGAVNASDILRLRMNLLANNATGTASSTAFTLQYTQSSSCSLSTNAWFDVGEIGSTTAAFSGYDNSLAGDGTTLASSTLASTTVFATYEEENFSTAIPNEIPPGDYGEWDWVIQNTNATVNSTYCFRMVRASGEPIATYTTYPALETAGPPLAPTLLVYFDNEHTPDLTPVLEFTTTDLATDDIHYQVQIDDTDLTFTNIVVNRNSEDNGTEFSNLNTPSDKAPFDNGARIRFTSSATIASSTTHYWRVRGRDPAGTNTWGDWSTPYSFTTNQNISISEWFQTRDEQFDTNTLDGLETSGSDEISVISGSTTGTMIGTSVDFDGATVGNAWGSFSWNDTPSTGTTTYQVQFFDGSSWTLIPDTDLPGNSTGATSSPISLVDLNTTTYNQIRPFVTIEGTTPTIQDWTISWSLRVDTATLQDPFNHEKIPTTTPTFQFFTTDPQGDDLQYELSWSTDNTFVTGSTTVNSTTTPTGWGNLTTPADTDPFNSGDIITYTVQPGQALTDDTTYWWRVRAKDPNGSNSFAPWSTPFALTASTSVSVSTWFQTTQEQFEDATLTGTIASTSDSATIASQIGEYGTTTVTNGTWTLVNTQLSYADPVVVTSVRYSSSTEVQRTSRVRNKTASSFEILADNYDGSVTGTTVVDWLVMETGDWTIEDGAVGTRVVAGTIEEVSVVESNGLPNLLDSPNVNFSPAFSGVPSIITSVSTANDTTWVFSSTHDGEDSDNLHTSLTFGAFLNRNFEPATHSAEDIDYVAFEPNTGTNNGSQFEALVSPQVVDEATTAVNFTNSFSAAPQVTLVQAATQSGANGGYVYVDEDNPTSATQIFPLFDEDGSGADRIHANEIASIVVFEDPDGILIRASSTLSGTIAGNAIPFSDGNGPKFERYLFNNTNTGNSTTTLQVQYLVGTSTWTLIPDSAIPGNSTGTTTSPVDLTNVDVSTYSTIRLFGSLECEDSSNCPELHDWTVEWSEGVEVSGTAQEYDRSTNVTSGTVRVAVNGVLQGNTGTISAGTWTINNITAFAGDTVTVFVDGATEADEAVNVFLYDGVGDMNGIELYEQHLTFSSNELATTSNAFIAAYDNSVSGDEDIFFDVDAGNNLNVCAQGGCQDANIYIGPGNIFAPATTTNEVVMAHDIVNDGTIFLSSNTIEINGSWDNNATSTSGSASLVFSATSTSETLDDVDDLLVFGNVTFGTTSGTASWEVLTPMDLGGDLTVDFGTMDRGTSTINLTGSISTGASGLWSGVATTTMDGAGANTWTDSNATSQNVGHLVVDGAVNVVTVGSDVLAQSLEIGADDTVNGGGANTISLIGDFTNNNTFTANGSTVDIIATSTMITITAGGSSFNNLTFSGVDGISAFTDANITVTNDFTIATGTVTLPTATTTIAGSFLNTDGTFMHNNGEIEFTGSGSETITMNGSTFLNAFYDATFSGSGTWGISDTNATTSNNFLIENGTVTFPSGSLTIGADFTTSGSGAFAHNNGEVILLIMASDQIVTNGSNLNDVRVRSASSGWYDNNWGFRLPITIQSSQVDANLTNFPVYVDLADLGSGFFSNLNSDGGDIRITASDGVTEIAREVVSASTTLETGQLWFNGTSVSSSTDTTFYIYYGNSSASDYATTTTYGANNVWDANHLAVYHLEEDASGSTTDNLYLDSTSNADYADDRVAATGKDGQIGSGQEISGRDNDVDDYIALPATVFNGESDLTISYWFRSSITASQGVVSIGGGNDLLLFQQDDQIVPYQGGAGPTFSYTSTNDGNWHHMTVIRDDTSNEWSVYIDGQPDDQNPQSDALSTLSIGADCSVLGQEQDGCFGSGGTFDASQAYDGFLDEFVVSSGIRSDEWIEASYLNQATTTDFYATSTAEAAFVRTFADTNATALGNMIIESGEAVFPSGTLSVGGSFDNDGVFRSNNGTVLFDSSAGSETIAAGSSTFATVTFNNASGDFTVTENATATTAWNLTNADSFTVNSTVEVEVTGLFNTQIGGASTTWSGSTLYLNSGTDYDINASTSPADAYGTLRVGTTTDIGMWNSTSTIYTIDTGGSLYSQDHNNADGDLYIFGEYERSSGTDYWSYATDFDGTDLSGGSERQVDVRFANNSTSTFTGNATLQILGDAAASTTVQNQGSGDYAVLLGATSTINAQHYSFADFVRDGLTLTGSTTVTSLADGAFELTQDGGSTITLGAEVIDANPTLQIQRVEFATTTAITGANVTATGTPTSYFWFRNHYGNLDGEDFDTDPGGNPGNVRWEDSGFTITVSGNVYGIDRTTAIGNPPCDGSTAVVRVRVNGGGDHTGSCDAGTGAYSVSGVTFSGTPILTTYLDTNGGARAVTVTKTPTGNITDMDLYHNHVIIRHEDTDTMAIADLDGYDSGGDADIPFLATVGGTDTLVVEPNNALFIWDGKTFIPDGNVTLNSGGSTEAQDGSLYVDGTGTFTASTTEAHSIGGEFVLDLAATFDAASTTITFTATTTGKTIAATSTLNEVVFNGSGGGWNIASSTTIAGDVVLTAGTATGTGDVMVQGGDITGDGVFNMTGGTVTLEGTGSFGGASNWTFNGLTFGDGSTVATTTKTGAGSIESSGVLTIATNHILDASDSNWELSGGGTPFVVNGTFDANQSLFTYSGTVATNVTTETYDRLTLAATSGSPTYTILGGTLSVLDALIVGDGTNAVTVTANTNDPTVTVGGDITINQNGTLIGSDSQTLTAGASWLNSGTYTHSNGTVLFNATSTGHSITASTSPFFNATLDSTIGGWTITESATATNNFSLSNADTFILSGGSTLEVDGQFSNDVGGASTTWTGSYLYLNSGTNYTVNGTSTNDVYETLTVGNNTDVRLWNSSAGTTTVSTSGSLYSQDHAANDGDLYIWGDYVNSLGNDYWSFQTDFDGTSIPFGSGRQVDVRLADNATTTLSGVSLTILGTSTASTTIAAQGSGTYAFNVTGGTFSAEYYNVRDINVDGINISGTPTISELGHGDFLVEIAGGTGITVAGGTIDANTGMTFSNNIFATSSAIAASNVTATGASTGSWRFTTYTGNIGGEAFDTDPGGDPGYIIWDDSDSAINISGTVYTDDGLTTAGAPTCNGSNLSVHLRVQGAGSLSTTCDGSGNYSFTGVVPAPGDVITVYLDADNGATFAAATVTVDPLTNITNMDLYQDRVIVRHEDTDPINIDDMAVCDSSVAGCDTDIPFDATDSSPDTLVLDAGTELYIWDSKTFRPAGNITLHGNGGGEPDGTLHIDDNATLVATGTEAFSVAGSFDMKSGATFIAASSTVTMTATTTGKVVSATTSPFYDITFSGSGGAWSFPPNTLTTTNDFAISGGTVTLGNATTTVGGSFDNTGGTFAHNNGLVLLTASTTGQTVEAGGSDFFNLTFNGSGGAWTFQDTNATTTNDLIITVGSTTLPTGTFALGGEFLNNGGTFTSPNTSTQRFTSTATENIFQNGSDFGSTTFDGSGGAWTFIDENATSTGDFVILNGSVTLATGTQAVAESFDNSGTFTSGATTTVRLYGSGSGETIRASSSLFTNLIIDGSSGNWTLTGDATTTNRFDLLNADDFTASGFIEVQGEFQNLVGGASTTWTGSTLFLDSSTNYTINSKTQGGDVYETLVIGNSASSTDIRLWNSTSTIYTTNGTSSIYSQDHNSVDGDLYIWGQYELSSGTDNWSFATDFDGTVLSAPQRRAVSVEIDSGATTTYSGGTLAIIGVDGSTTTINNQGSGLYGIQITDGTLSAQYYQFQNMNALGLNISGSSTVVSSLSNGDFRLAQDDGATLRVASTTIDNNPTLIIDNTQFSLGGASTGFNASRDASSTNAWTFNSHYGDLDGESFDDDGGTLCGSFRWDDSSCLFVSQQHFRWRNDDGGEGVPNSEWFDTGWDYRQKVVVGDTAATSSTNLAVEVTVPYDSDMQADFDDLRFTDASGTTSVDYWIESVTASTEATVWVEVPSLSANASTTLYMYYGSTTASDAGVGTTTFDTFDDFEDNNITEYSGDTSLFETSTSFNYEGLYGLDAVDAQVGAQTTNGLYQFAGASSTVSQGETMRYFQYIDMTTGGDDEACTLFGVQNPTNGNNYAVCLDPFNADQVVLAENVTSNDSSGTTLATTSVTFTTGWYEIEIDWETDNDIFVSVYSGGTLFATTTANDSSYTSGGFGFSFWGQHGGWDAVSVRKHLTSMPNVQFGLEQGNGGATWKAAEDTVITEQDVGDIQRLRLSLSNTGADLTGENLRLQYAAKGASLSCESVLDASYADVPTPTAGCGTSPVCFATSTNFTNLASTTEQLSGPDTSMFTYGQMVEDPSNETGTLNIASNEFTEAEYVFEMTSFVTDDAYCFRTTDSGTAYDDYSRVAEINLKFAPIITNFTLNSALDITLTPGTTTTVSATGTAIDLNGFADLDYATTSIYRSAVGAQCTADENNCYQVASTSCTFSFCSGNSCELECTADMQYFTDPTDSGAFSAQEWLADITIVDTAAESDTGTTLGVEVLTLRAITASSSIPYGSLSVNTDTDDYNATTTITNDGNDNIDVSLSGTDLTNGASSIGVANQLYSTTTFTYSACGLCGALSGTPTQVEVDLFKPTSSTTPIRDDIYWGLFVPTNTAAVSHDGTNTFTAVGD